VTAALIPPHSLETERAVLGSLLGRPAAVLDVVERLRPELFYRQAHQVIATAIRTRTEDTGLGPDLVCLTTQLRHAGHLDAVGGPAYVASLLDGVPLGVDLTPHFALLEGLALKRRVLEMGAQLVAAASAQDTEAEAVVTLAETAVLDLQQPTRAEWRSLADVMGDVVRDLDKPAAERRRAVRTGFWQLDDFTHGLAPGDLVLVGARPSMGKTAFALQIALAAADCGVTVGVASLEMTSTALGQRAAASEARINTSRIFSGALQERDYQSLAMVLGRTTHERVFLCDQSDLTIGDLLAKARRLKARQPALGLFIVDYLTLLEAAGETRHEQVSRVSRRLKGLAKTLDVPLLVLAQLNRALESRADKRPMLSDLRESGALEQDADQVWFLYRAHVYDDREPPEAAEVIIAKARNGPTGVVPLRFIREWTRFEDWEAPV